MRVATTTGDFTKYGLSIKESVGRIYEAGFRYLDLSLYSAYEYEPFMTEDWKILAQEILDYAKELGMEFVQCHAPCGNGIEENEELAPYIETTIRSLEVAAYLGIKNVVIHAGCLPGITKEEFFERNLRFFEKLYPAMEANQVNLLVENSTKANCRNNMYYFFTGEDLAEFLKRADHPLLHACWDTGHANIEGHQYEDMMALGEDLYAIHFNDNPGDKDRHMIPFDGTLNIAEVMHGLIDSGFKGDLVFESGYVFSGNNRVYEGDERMRRIPLEVWQAKEHMMYVTGVEILKAYDLYEE